MSNALAPVARQRVFTDLGVVAPGALLNTYIAGTPSTPLGTTSDAAGLVANTNPIVASAGGLFGPIYLTPNVAYHLRLTDAGGLPIWDQDPVTGGVGGTLAVSGGGTGLAALAPAWGPLVAGATPTSAVGIITPGPANSPLLSGGAAAPPVYGAHGAPVVVGFSGNGTVPFDASQGSLVFIVANGPCTLAVPTNPRDGQKLLIRFVAFSGGPQTLTLTSFAGGATPGGFRFSAALPGLTQTAANLTDYIGCVYYAGPQCWDVVAVSKGY
jgi:hypothetical protein